MATKQHCVFVCAALLILATHIATANYTADWAVEIIEGEEGMAHTIAGLYGFSNLGKIGGLENVYHFKKIGAPNNTETADSFLERLLLSEPSVVLAEHQLREEREIKSLPSSGGIHQPKGRDNFSVSIQRAWNQSLSGCNISVAVVDDVIDVEHDDLYSNFAPNISYDVFHRMGLVPSKQNTKQGTTCSRIIASSSPMANESCVLGIAYKSNLGAIQIFGFDSEQNRDRYATDITEAIALSFESQMIDIYSNCWGAPDTGADVSGPKTITRRILADGVTKGRDGKGSIFVWANGNGGPNDDCAADGYASSPYTISVGAIREDGKSSEYDEPCSAKLTVAPVTNGRNTTTKETECDIVLNGTSAAASMVSGIIALALEANSNLTWRDVQYLIVYTANPNLTAGPLTQNGAGLAVSRQYGFGVMDAEAMVTRARHWINVLPKRNETTIPPNQSGTASKNATFLTTLNYTGKISYLEHVVVVISISAYPRGGIQINLVSPAGTNVTLLQNRPNDIQPGKYNKWPFVSVMFWGENPSGNWTLTISNSNSSDAIITVEQCEFHGVLYTPTVVARIPEECHSDYCYDASAPVDECESPLKEKIEMECNKCESICTYTYIAQICGCENGYELQENGYNCSDINECLNKEEYGCVGECMDGVGYYSCSECGPGFKPSLMGSKCEDKKECDTDNGGCQHLCMELPGSYQCDCYPGYTLDSDNHNCSELRFIPLEMNSSNIEGDDNISPEIDFPEFPVGCKNLTKVYVGTNGYFTFDGFTGFTPFRFARGNGLSLVAPFFIDIGDTTDASGTIKYEFNDNSTSEVAKNVNRIIRREIDPYFRGKQFLIASWEEVSPYSNPNNIKITFQGILATNQRKTYAIFTYKCDGNKFPVKPTVGYVTEDGMVFNYEATLQNNPLQNNPYQIICNSTTDEYVNIVLKISESECKPAFDDCKQE